MRITPAEAAIIGTSLGATATLSAAWTTQRATSRRERERRIRDHRVATYEDLMSTVHTYAQLRAHTRQTFDLPQLEGVRNEALHSPAAPAARIELYSSERPREACEKSFDGMQRWLEAWEDRHDQGPDVRLPSRADGLWRKFTDRVEESEAADSELLDLLLADIHGERKRSSPSSPGRFLGIKLSVTTSGSSASWETSIGKSRTRRTRRENMPRAPASPLWVMRAPLGKGEVRPSCRRRTWPSAHGPWTCPAPGPAPR
ncbi:hypothetical protein AB0I51_01150 [Streptomyces sp. NPDC050549]|uniref:hypothetical protein n=1 Tax=Streptomyces sp. NPDC050549 TaxID=3155406 RepID=UPI00341DF58D